MYYQLSPIIADKERERERKRNEMTIVTLVFTVVSEFLRRCKSSCKFLLNAFFEITHQIVQKSKIIAN